MSDVTRGTSTAVRTDAPPDRRGVWVEDEPDGPLDLVLSTVRWIVVILGIGAVLLTAMGLVFGWKPAVVRTGSMAPAVPTGSVVLLKPEALDQVKVGEIVGAAGAGDRFTLHRVVSTETVSASQLRLVLKGDANSAADQAIVVDQVYTPIVTLPALLQPLTRLNGPMQQFLLGLLAGGIVAAYVGRRAYRQRRERLREDELQRRLEVLAARRTDAQKPEPRLLGNPDGSPGTHDGQDDEPRFERKAGPKEQREAEGAADPHRDRHSATVSASRPSWNDGLGDDYEYVPHVPAVPADGIPAVAAGLMGAAAGWAATRAPSVGDGLGDRAVRSEGLEDGAPGQPEPLVGIALPGLVPGQRGPSGTAGPGARERDRELLRALGVPASWLQNLHGADRFDAVMSMLGACPEVSEVLDLRVVAVIGAEHAVQRESHRIAVDLQDGPSPRPVLRLPVTPGGPRQVLVAMPQSAGGANVVAIECPEGAEETGVSAIPAVDADMVVAVLRARRPHGDLMTALRRTDRPLAIAFDGPARIQDVMPFLAAGVPVIRVDGVPLDRVALAALLCAQLRAPDDVRPEAPVDRRVTSPARAVTREPFSAPGRATEVGGFSDRTALAEAAAAVAAGHDEDGASLHGTGQHHGQGRHQSSARHQPVAPATASEAGEQ